MFDREMVTSDVYMCIDDLWHDSLHLLDYSNLILFGHVLVKQNCTCSANKISVTYMALYRDNLQLVSEIAYCFPCVIAAGAGSEHYDRSLPDVFHSVRQLRHFSVAVPTFSLL